MTPKSVSGKVVLVSPVCPGTGDRATGRQGDRQEGDQQAMSKGTTDCSAFAAGCITKHASCRTTEEVRDHTGQNQYPMQLTQDKQSDQATDKAGDKANQHRIRRIGKDNRAIERGSGFWHQFF